MRIFQSFLLLVVTAILWMLPVTQGIYDFRTDPREDTFNVDTAVGVTTASVVLQYPVYDSDNQTIDLSSDLPADTPALDSYTPATDRVDVSGLSDNSTRVLTIGYLIDALDAHDAVNTLMDILPMIWILILVSFPVVGLVAVWRA